MKFNTRTPGYARTHKEWAQMFMRSGAKDCLRDLQGIVDVVGVSPDPDYFLDRIDSSKPWGLRNICWLPRTQSPAIRAWWEIRQLTPLWDMPESWASYEGFSREMGQSPRYPARLQKVDRQIPHSKANSRWDWGAELGN